MKYTLNFRFLIKVGVALVVMLVGIYVLHRWQAGRQVELFRELAAAAREDAEKSNDETKLDQEITYLTRYLTRRPGDLDARERLGRIRFIRAKNPKELLTAFFILEDALRRDPQRKSLERYVIEVALDPRMMLVAEARGYIERIPGYNVDGDLVGQLGICFEVTNDLPKAAGLYEKSRRIKPDRVASYTRLAYVLQRVKDPDTANRVRTALDESQSQLTKDREKLLKFVADDVIVDLIRNNSENYLALIDAAAYYRRFGSMGQVRSAVESAYKLAPDKADVVLAATTLESDAARGFAEGARLNIGNAHAAWVVAAATTRNRARSLGERGLQLDRSKPSMYRARAEIETDAGNLKEAEAILLSGTQVSPESTELWLSISDVRILRGDASGADSAIARAKETGLDESVARFQSARVLALREKWLEAEEAIASVRDKLVDTAYGRSADLLWAKCCEKTGQLDRRIAAFNHLLAIKDPADPISRTAMIGLAEARTRLGQIDAALEVYHTLVTVDDRYWLSIAQLRYYQMLRQGNGELKSRPLDEAISQAKKVFAADTTDLVLLEVNLANLRKNREQARSLLVELSRKKHTDESVWVALAAQDFGDGDRDRARSTLAAAKQAIGDKVSLRLAQALLVDPKAPNASQDIAALADGVGALSASDQLRLLRGLAEVSDARGYSKNAHNFWAKAIELDKDDLSMQLRRIDSLLRTNDFDAVKEVLNEIKRLDGDRGPSYKAATAALMVRRAQLNPQENGKALEEADQVLAEIERVRPGWPRIAVGQGIISDLQHLAAERNRASNAEQRRLLDRAISRFEKALQLDLVPDVVKRLVFLYSKAGRQDQAIRLLDKLPADVLGTAGMSRLAAHLNLLLEQPDKAMIYAKQAVQADSTDQEDLVWQAAIFRKTGSAGEWEKPLRKAVASPNGNPIPLLTLTQYLVADGRKDEANKAISEFIDKVESAKRFMTLARCKQIVGDTEEARKAFEKARSEQPNDIAVMESFAGLLMSTGNFGEAVGQLQRLTELPSVSPDERKRALMAITYCQLNNPEGNYQLTREAIKKALAEVRLPENATTAEMPGEAKPDDFRYAAFLLAGQVDRPSKLQAIRYLERLQVELRRSNRETTTSDRLIWALLHASLNQPNEARLRFQEALDSDEKNALILASYIGFMLRQRRADLSRDAERNLNTLKSLQPNAARTIELDARLAVAQKRTDDARRLIKLIEAKPGVNISRLAGLCEELDLFEDAGRLYLLAGEQPKKPEGLLGYAAFLGRRQEVEKALDRCEEARRQNCPPVAVTAVAVVILYNAQQTQATQIERVMGWIYDGLAKVPAQSPLAASILHHQAALLSLRGDHNQAISIYERVLAIKADYEVAILAMNNLAFLLAAHKKDFRAALTTIEKAKSYKGPIPELLDTESLIHLAHSKSDTGQGAKLESAEVALRLLNEIEGQAPTAVTYYHLARAHLAKSRLASGKAVDIARGDARLAWDEARKRKPVNELRAELHPLEWADFEDLKRELSGSGGD